MVKVSASFNFDTLRTVINHASTSHRAELKYMRVCYKPGVRYKQCYKQRGGLRYKRGGYKRGVTLQELCGNQL